MRLTGLIYNPVAGDTGFKSKLDQVISLLQAEDMLVIPYRTTAPGDAFKGVEKLLELGCESILAAGGDGTIHQVVEAMIAKDADLPLGIFPVGTANDFGAQLGLNKSVEMTCKLILDRQIRTIDLGSVNGKIFINVAGVGNLTEVSQRTDLGIKHSLGRLGYFITGLEQLPKFKPIYLEVSTDKLTVREPVSLLLVLNGGWAGGFRFSPTAQVEDGLLDVLIIRSSTMPEFLSLFVKLLFGEHLNDPKVLLLKTAALEVRAEGAVSADMDGERAPELPWQVKVLPQRLKVFAQALERK